MTNKTLKASIFAATTALALLAPTAQGQIARPAGLVPATVGQVIAAQGNAAVRAIRAEVLSAVKVVKPELPQLAVRARVRKVSAPVQQPASTGGSISATAACAE